ncbi:MAG: retroviral-like aspartic protease family protein [Chroococcus sp. CMT-3BRIN-NPC107]|jgi:clan AA aspartic protease (TIGR02281 family)|nr:retroviral-like aspartic protease family protein [Chroococcus sp. CMT-3BRIN-NPC107]
MRQLPIRLELILLTGILASTGAACNKSRLIELPQNTQVVIKDSPAPQTAKLPPLIKPDDDRFEMALDKAYGALIISQSAQGAEDWRLIAMQWSEAISLMKTVPARSPNKVIAQKKILQYQQNLKYAQQQAIRPVVRSRPLEEVAVASVRSPVPAPPTLPVPPSGVFQTAIKNRHGGTPVVDVIFNGGQRFEMIVDTGASGTVITQQMAAALGIVPIGRVRANTASDRNVEFAIGNVSSIEVGGAVVQNVPVAIAPTASLDLGLLGQDFFSNYDVTIERDVVEFRSR